MRGVAALAVMLHHVELQLLGTTVLRAGYLAVDFFFMLSGFVLAGAYERRFAEGLPALSFMWLRIKRLWPVMAVGVLAGALVFRDMVSGELPIRLAAQLLFLPVILRSLPLYPLDGVQWSLFFELFANAVHAAFLKAASVRQLALLAAASLLLLAIAGSWNGSLAVGDRGMNILGGVPRVLFSYTLGVLLFRVRERGFLLSFPVPGSFVIALLPLVFVVDGLVRGAAPAWVVDLIVVTTILPGLVIVGAGGDLSPRLQPVARMLGLLSYPLYAVHLPAIAAAAGIYGHGGTAAAFSIPLSLISALGLALALEPGGRAFFIHAFRMLNQTARPVSARMD